MTTSTKNPAKKKPELTRTVLKGVPASPGFAMGSVFPVTNRKISVVEETLPESRLADEEQLLQEVKDLLDFAQAYNGTYLKSIYEKVSKDLGASGFSQEEVYRMLFGTEMDPAKNLDRPLSKLKRDLLEYLNIIEKE